MNVFFKLYSFPYRFQLLFSRTGSISSHCISKVLISEEIWIQLVLFITIIYFNPGNWFFLFACCLSGKRSIIFIKQLYFNFSLNSFPHFHSHAILCCQQNLYYIESKTFTNIQPQKPGNKFKRHWLWRRCISCLNVDNQNFVSICKLGESPWTTRHDLSL